MVRGCWVPTPHNISDRIRRRFLLMPHGNPLYWLYTYLSLAVLEENGGLATKYLNLYCLYIRFRNIFISMWRMFHFSEKMKEEVYYPSPS